ncbi:MAG: anti-phage BREX system Lon protease BrxL, partial [Candidatus Thorarchaeota archaeon]
MTVNKLCSVFPDMVVYKSAEKNKFFSSLSIPSYLRDWLLRRYADKQGNVDVDIVHEYINQKIPRREQWESLKSEMVNNGACVRILAKVQAQVDVTSGEMLFSLPDLAFPSRKYEALVEPRLAREKRDLLLAAPETWGVIALEW